MHDRLNEYDPPGLKRKFKALFWIVAIAMALLCCRLLYLQIIKGDEFQARSENNSVRLRKIKPLRGFILDTHRQVLVDNQPAFDLMYIPNRTTPVGETVEAIKARYIARGLTPNLDAYPTGRLQPFVPIRLERNISREKLAVIENHALEMPGVVVEVVPIRKYLFKEMLAQVIGYTGEVSAGELEAGGRKNLAPGDTVGKFGIERCLDAYLGGTSGAEQVEVNAAGKVVKALGRIEPIPGHNVQLTVDVRLQTAAWEALGGRPGAVVVMDPRDGSVLAMVSSPSFDPNLFNGGISTKAWEQLSKDPLYPMENRAIAGQYPPASTYKVVVAAAGLEDGIVHKDRSFFCNGAFELGTRTYRCWQKNGHGHVNLHRSLVESCDVYYYHLGKMIGVDRLAGYADRFGFGRLTGIDLPREKTGLVPTRAWKLARTKEPWQMGETIPVSIGQGFNLVTPLQLATAYSALANGGTLYRPRVVKQIETVDGQVVKAFPPQKNGDLGLRPETIALINNGLWGVVNGSGGTGSALRRPEADVAGKTGTAQVVGLPGEGKARRLRALSARHRDHALFACFAPWKQPEITVAVVMENAGHGGSAAAPVARKIVDAYFEAKKGPPTVRKATDQTSPGPKPAEPSQEADEDDDEI
jgi:penicillin-binding protein 2